MKGTHSISGRWSLTRRRHVCVGLTVLAGLLVASVLVVVYAVALEPRWVVVRTVRLADPPALRLIHITDLHYKGDRAYLERVVRRLNAIPADLLCIPGGGPLLDLPLVGGYKRGLYQTRAGPLYVNPGLGTFYAPIRFGCRPEITVIEL